MFNVSSIEKLRKEKLFTQETFSKEIGMTKNGYQTALKKKDFKVSVLVKIAEVLGVSVGYFFEGGNKKDTDFIEEQLKFIFLRIKDDEIKDLHKKSWYKDFINLLLSYYTNKEGDKVGRVLLTELTIINSIDNPKIYNFLKNASEEIEEKFKQL